MVLRTVDHLQQNTEGTSFVSRAHGHMQEGALRLAEGDVFRTVTGFGTCLIFMERGGATRHFFPDRRSIYLREINVLFLS